MTLLSNNLQAFVAVKEQLTVAAAAKVLYLTQAAVTLRIRALEEQLKTTLFIRSRRGMQLTEAGHQLARYCQRHMELEAEILPNLPSISEDLRPLSIVIQGPSSVITTRVIPKMGGYLKQHQAVSLNLNIEGLESGIERLKRGDIDVLISEKKQITKEFDSKVIQAERYILVGPKSWKKRPIDQILTEEKIIDFDESDMMTFNFLEKYNLKQKAKPSRHFVNMTSAIGNLVAGGVGYSVLSKETAAPFIDDGQLIDLLPNKYYDYELGVAWYPRKQMPKAFADLIKLISAKN